MQRLSLKVKCTCGTDNDKHYLSCDIWYEKLKDKMFPKKRKRFFIFYPLKEK